MKKIYVKNMFDSIASKYDFLNHLLSGGIDFYWRKKALKKTKINDNSKVLDVACGTGDFSIAANKLSKIDIYAADLSLEMLKIFNQKFKKVNGKSVQSEAELLPFLNESFDNILVAFGIRNFYNINQSIESFFNLLKENGKLTILEFSLPKNYLMLKIYLFYFRTILPLIGKLISKNKDAYKYLPDSVREFEEKINIPDLLTKKGFSKIKYYKLTFGIVQLIIATK